MSSLLDQAQEIAEQFGLIDDDALDKITAEVLATYKRRADLERAVFSAVRGHIRIRLRSTTRRHEHTAPLRIAEFTVDEDADDPIARRMDLLRASAAVPGKGWMQWGAFTIEDHEARMEMLEKYAAGNLATAKKHREAISVIRSTPGAKTLFDVASKAAA